MKKICFKVKKIGDTYDYYVSIKKFSTISEYGISMKFKSKVVSIVKIDDAIIIFKDNISSQFYEIIIYELKKTFLDVKYTELLNGYLLIISNYQKHYIILKINGFIYKGFLNRKFKNNKISIKQKSYILDKIVIDEKMKKEIRKSYILVAKSKIEIDIKEFNVHICQKDMKTMQFSRLIH